MFGLTETDSVFFLFYFYQFQCSPRASKIHTELLLIKQTTTKKHKCLGKVNDVDWKQIRYQELNSSIKMGRQYTVGHDWDNKFMQKEKEAKLRKRQTEDKCNPALNQCKTSLKWGAEKEESVYEMDQEESVLGDGGWGRGRGGLDQIFGSFNISLCW